MRLKDQLNQNTSVIQNLRINYDNNIDYSKELPSFFNIRFSDSGRDFYLRFAKVSAHDKITSPDIYVIDQTTGHPAKFDVTHEEVISINSIRLFIF